MNDIQNKGYKNLIVWQKAMDLVDEIYKIIKVLPKEENFSLSDQMRRASISIPSNIAEGYERYSKKEYIRYFILQKVQEQNLKHNY